MRRLAILAAFACVVLVAASSQSCSEAQASSYRLSGATTGSSDAGAPEHRFNVKDYGALGDNAGWFGGTSASHDTDAIQATINVAADAGGGAVFFPSGTYRICRPLEIHDPDISLVGEGRQHTTIKADATCFQGPVVYVHPNYEDNWGTLSPDAGICANCNNAHDMGAGQGVGELWANLTLGGSVLSLHGLGRLTVGAYLKPRTIPSGGTRAVLVSQGKMGTEGGRLRNGFGFQVVGNVDGTKFSPRFNVTTTAGTEAMGGIAACELDTATGGHVQFEWYREAGGIGSPRASIYINGVRCDTETTAPWGGTLVIDSVETLTLGASQQGILDQSVYTSAMDGYVDELWINQFAWNVNNATLASNTTSAWGAIQSTGSPGACGNCYLEFDFESHAVNGMIQGYIGSHGIPSYTPIRMGTGQEYGSLGNIEVSGLEFYQAGRAANFLAQTTLHSTYENLKFTGGHTLAYGWDNGYKARWANVEFTGDSATIFGLVLIGAMGINEVDRFGITGAEYAVVLGSGGGVWTNAHISLSASSKWPLYLSGTSGNDTEFLFNWLGIEGEAAGLDLQGCAWISGGPNATFIHTHCNIASRYSLIAPFFIDPSIGGAAGDNTRVSFRDGQYAVSRPVDGGVGWGVFGFSDAGYPGQPIWVENFRPMFHAEFESIPLTLTEAESVNVKYLNPIVGSATVTSGGTTKAVGFPVHNNEPDQWYKVFVQPTNGTCPDAYATSKADAGFTITTDSATGADCAYNWMLTR